MVRPYPYYTWAYNNKITQHGPIIMVDTKSLVTGHGPSVSDDTMSKASWHTLCIYEHVLVRWLKINV